MKLSLLRLLAAVAKPFTRKPAAGPPQRVLVIKPDHLGDLLLATPALTVLRKDWPGCHIVGLVGPWSSLIWRDCPALDALVELPFPGFERTSPGHGHIYPYLLLLKYALLLRRTHYDAALLLRDDHWWGAALAAVAGIPQRIGQAHPLCAPLLSRALPYQPRQHVTRQAIAVVNALQAPDAASYLPVPGQPATVFLPSEADQQWVDGWIKANLAPGERLVLIHPGTGGIVKHWLPAAWATVADALAADSDLRILLTGGPAETSLVTQIAALMEQPALTLAGQTSLGRLAALLGRATLVLGVDSGPLHIAVSQGTPTLHLFGPSDEARFGPWGNPHRHLVLRAGLFCSPCGVFTHCPRGTDGPECMTALSASTVIAAARHLLG